LYKKRGGCSFCPHQQKIKLKTFFFHKNSEMEKLFRDQNKETLKRNETKLKSDQVHKKISLFGRLVLILCWLPLFFSFLFFFLFKIRRNKLNFLSLSPFFSFLVPQEYFLFFLNIYKRV